MIAAGYEDGNDANTLRVDPIFKMALDLSPGWSEPVFAVDDLVSGVTCHLKVRTGFMTTPYAAQGTAAFFSGSELVGECTNKLELPMHAYWG
jgi:hypothetical protein